MKILFKNETFFSYYAQWKCLFSFLEYLVILTITLMFCLILTIGKNLINCFMNDMIQFSHLSNDTLVLFLTFITTKNLQILIFLTSHHKLDNLIIFRSNFLPNSFRYLWSSRTETSLDAYKFICSLHWKINFCLPNTFFGDIILLAPGWVIRFWYVTAAFWYERHFHCFLLLEMSWEVALFMSVDEQRPVSCTVFSLPSLKAALFSYSKHTINQAWKFSWVFASISASKNNEVTRFLLWKVCMKSEQN